jgi:hypothetical protein
MDTATHHFHSWVAGRLMAQGGQAPANGTSV